MTPGGAGGGLSDDQVANTLVPVLEILDSFNHRNKNQHRVAHWWSQFGLLRRSVRRLYDALTTRSRHQQAQSFKTQKKSASKSGGNDRRKNALDDDITTQVRLLLDTTLPSSFLAFTQLTADNQHAALGLALLGLLASINSAIAPLAPPPPQTGGHIVTPEPPRNLPAVTAAGDEKEPESMGLGVAISRDQLKLAAKAPARRSGPDDKEDVNPLTKPKKRKLDTPATEGKPGKPANASKDRKPEKKSIKKKSKKSDEFSDLFSSLM